MTRLRFTIVTPSYNQVRYLGATLRSVLAQSYSDYEYIVMDGGSEDGSVELIRQYDDKIAYWQSERDGGQAAAIRAGFERGTGDIFGFLNSDDIYFPHALEEVARHFQENPKTEWLIGGCVTIDAEGRLVSSRLRLPSCNLGARVTHRQLVNEGCRFNQPATFWRRTAYEKVRGIDPSLHFSFDYDLYLRLALRGKSAALRSFLAAFRLHGASKTSTLQHQRAREDRALLAKYPRAKLGEGPFVKGRMLVNRWMRGVLRHACGLVARQQREFLVRELEHLHRK